MLTAKKAVITCVIRLEQQQSTTARAQRARVGGRQREDTHEVVASDQGGGGREAALIYDKCPNNCGLINFDSSFFKFMKIEFTAPRRPSNAPVGGGGDDSKRVTFFTPWSWQWHPDLSSNRIPFSGRSNLSLCAPFCSIIAPRHLNPPPLIVFYSFFYSFSCWLIFSSSSSFCRG